MTLFFADSHPGKKRDHNEDSFEADPRRGLYLVADGVGGHANGEVASAIVRDTLVRECSAEVALADAIRHSHREVLREIARRPASNMGSTVVALQLRGSEYEIAWVGDSRAYLFDGNLRQITRDHNPVSEMLARGVITAEQAAHHPERNVLSQSLGVSEAVAINPEHKRGELLPGQQILLCSDGLTDELSDEEIARLMREHRSPESQVGALIEAALEAGGRDNVTVIVVGDSAAGLQGTSSAAGFTTDLDTASNATPGPNTRAHDRIAWLLLGGMAMLILLWLVW